MDLDFCLLCGKKTLGGLYCSQACRLDDLEKSATSSGQDSRHGSSPLAPTLSPASTMSARTPPSIGSYPTHALPVLGNERFSLSRSRDCLCAEDSYAPNDCRCFEQPGYGYKSTPGPFTEPLRQDIRIWKRRDVVQL